MSSSSSTGTIILLPLQWIVRLALLVFITLSFLYLIQTIRRSYTPEEGEIRRRVQFEDHPKKLELNNFFPVAPPEEQLKALRPVAPDASPLNDSQHFISGPFRPKGLKPIVIAWTTFFGEDLSKMIEGDMERGNCPLTCEFTTNRSRLREASAVLYHGIQTFAGDLPIWRSTWGPAPINVLFLLESPVYSRAHLETLPQDFFDAAMTYRQDSSYVAPYGRMELLPEDANRTEIWLEVLAKFRRKTKGVLWMVSHCTTSSRRELIGGKMKQLLGDKMTIFTQCPHETFNVTEDVKLETCQRGAECESQAFDDHLFYAAFENSICTDYVTEKFWRLKQILVPLVLKRSIVQNIVPWEAVIAVDDFENITKFTGYIEYLMRNPDKYLEHLMWTRKYTRGGGTPTNGCKMCVDLHAGHRPQMPYPSYFHWWIQQAQCEEGYGQQMLDRWFPTPAPSEEEEEDEDDDDDTDPDPKENRVALTARELAKQRLKSQLKDRDDDEDVMSNGPGAKAADDEGRHEVIRQ